MRGAYRWIVLLPNNKDQKRIKNYSSSARKKWPVWILGRDQHRTHLATVSFWSNSKLRHQLLDEKKGSWPKRPRAKCRYARCLVEHESWATKWLTNQKISERFPCCCPGMFNYKLEHAVERKWESVPKTAWLCTIVTSFSKALANSHLKWTSWPNPPICLKPIWKL